MSKEVSAIEAIYLILDSIEDLKKQVNLIDQSIKILNNKVYNINSSIDKLSIPTEKTAANKIPKKSSFSAQPSVPEEESESSGLVLGKVKVYGYIVNADRVPIVGVQIIVSSGSNKIRDLKTNRDGYWEARLPSGSFSVEYRHKNFKPISKEISIPNNVTVYEVR
jgi:hypothetical protein